uniref:Uncharacterized protein n=1 Tax=Anguilla anguilla TaxID=7936 RepID=A0A0E9QJM9_ANGAN
MTFTRQKKVNEKSKFKIQLDA